MKISDEQLESFIRHIGDCDCPLYDVGIAIAEELQQLREERRWRKVSEELPEKIWAWDREDGKQVWISVGEPSNDETALRCSHYTRTDTNPITGAGGAGVYRGML